MKRFTAVKQTKVQNKQQDDRQSRWKVPVVLLMGLAKESGDSRWASTCLDVMAG